MKKIVIIFITCILLIACNQKNDGSFSMYSSELDSILDEYIATNPKNNIYYLIFENRNNKQFFTIQSSTSCYDSNYMDGCFMRKGKIIVFWSVNQSWKDSLLHIPQNAQCYDSLAKFTDIANNLMFYDAPYNPQTYRILSANQYRIATEADWAYPKPACDSNVIQSSTLNEIVNDYINSNNSPNIVYLRFSNFNGDEYVSIGYDFVYNPETISGMFYRNERIVVLYSIDKIKNIDIVDKQAMLAPKTINDYKAQKREFPRFPENKYRIVSKEIIEPISSDDKIWMDI